MRNGEWLDDADGEDGMMRDMGEKRREEMRWHGESREDGVE